MAQLNTAGRVRARRASSAINMVPFIDVMLVLLIIFMVCAPTSATSTIDIPTVGQAARLPHAAIEVEVHKDQSIAIQHGASSQATTMAELGRQVARMQKGAEAADPVLISADKTLPYQVITDVMDTLQRAGVQHIGLTVAARAGGAR